VAESSMKGKTHSHNTLNFLLRVQCVSNTYLNPRSPIRAGLFRWPPPVECMQATPFNSGKWMGQRWPASIAAGTYRKWRVRL